MKINISAIGNENGISSVQATDAYKVIGGGGSTINFNIGLQDGGQGNANADIDFSLDAQTIDLDANNSSNGKPYHQATLITSGKLGD